MLSWSRTSNYQCTVCCQRLIHILFDTCTCTIPPDWSSHRWRTTKCLLGIHRCLQIKQKMKVSEEKKTTQGTNVQTCRNVTFIRQSGTTPANLFSVYIWNKICFQFSYLSEMLIKESQWQLYFLALLKRKTIFNKLCRSHICLITRKQAENQVRGVYCTAMMIYKRAL